MFSLLIFRSCSLRSSLGFRPKTNKAIINGVMSGEDEVRELIPHTWVSSSDSFFNLILVRDDAAQLFDWSALINDIMKFQRFSGYPRSIHDLIQDRNTASVSITFVDELHNSVDLEKCGKSSRHRRR